MTSTTASSRAPATSAAWLPIFEYQLRVYRRTWRGSVFVRFLVPVFFLASMGIGLGAIVNRSTGGITVGDRQVPYLLFLVPAILAVQAMSTGMGESSWPVLGAIRWHGTYHAMLASPAQVRDILTAHCVFVLVQLTMSSSIFVLVAALFGGFTSWSALWLVPIAVLVGLAFVTPVVAFSAAQEGGDGFNLLFRLVQTPLMLFSGTFFPIAQLPIWLQPVAWVTPLWHGVELSRGVSLGTGTLPGLVGHLAVLVTFTVVGWWLALRSLRKRLVV